MVYRFIDKNKEQFGLRWLCRHFKISLNCYYNYLKDTKRDYYEQRFMVYERIKYIYYNNNRTIGYRLMKIFLQRYGIYLSTTTIHKYMNKDLNLSAIVMRKKPGYKSCKKHKIFDNLLKQKFNVDEKNKIWCTDFTYMRQPNGKFRYNCTIMDLFVSAKYCYAAHESRLHQNDRCKRFTLCLVLTVRFRSLAPWGKLFQLFI